MNEKSAELLAVARRFASRLPDTVGEISVSGSVSKGWADGGSDIELNVWSQELPDIEIRRALLVDAGAEDVVFDDRWTEPDGSKWGVFRFDGEAFEIGWQRIDACDELVGRIAAAEVTRHEALVIADVLTRCIALSGGDAIARWKRRLASYPEGLVRGVIEDSVTSWTAAQWVDLRWWFAKREQQLMLRHFLREDVDKSLDIICALSRRWPPVWKWVREEAALLSAAPAGFGAQAESVFSEANAGRAVEMAYRLALAALNLAPETERTALAKANLVQSLGTQGGTK